MVQVTYVDKNKKDSFWSNLFKLDKPLKFYQFRFHYHGEFSYVDLKNIKEIFFYEEGMMVHSDSHDKRFYFYEGLDNLNILYLYEK